MYSHIINTDPFINTDPIMNNVDIETVDNIEILDITELIEVFKVPKTVTQRDNKPKFKYYIGILAEEHLERLAGIFSDPMVELFFKTQDFSNIKEIIGELDRYEYSKQTEINDEYEESSSTGNFSQSFYEYIRMFENQIRMANIIKKRISEFVNDLDLDLDLDL